MMKINYNEYIDKVSACWTGKNIGGTMGVPYEGTREYLDVKGFKTDKNVSYPNDDLDLQLVWLHAMETLPPTSVNCRTLGEMWISYVPPHWNEYGIAKNNMKRGIFPPLAADHDNTWVNSNGAWIRTEIWATLFPGAPELACKYAIEDARVDHGAGEGTYAAAYVAALESIAFVEQDLRRAIEQAVEFIPAESRMAKSIRHTLECFDNGMSARAARDSIQQLNADIGNGWFEAPSNVCYVILGILWGGGDFKKSMIAALNCGDDTDCTGATLGSILGIHGGRAALPEDWCEHIGDSIITCSIASGVFNNFVYRIPSTTAQLTERVVALAPRILTSLNAGVEFTDGETDIAGNEIATVAEKVKGALSALTPNSYEIEAGALAATVTVDSDPTITPLAEKKISIKIENRYKIAYGNIPYVLKLRWLLPEGFTVSGSPASLFLHASDAHYRSEVTIDVTATAPECISAENRLVLEVVADGHFTPMYIPILLVG